MAGGTSCVKVRRGFSSAGSSPSNSSERFCSDVDMSVWWKKKCFSCAWNKEQASGVRVLSSAHCINELCKHQRTFDLQNASMKGVMFVYPASHVMGCSVVTSACVTHSYYGLSISWLPKWCGYHNHPFLDFSHCFKLTWVVSWFSHLVINLKYIGLELMTIHLLT